MSMARFLTVTASTKRAPVLAGGKRGVAVTQVATLKCTPLDPVSSEIQQRVANGAPMELLGVYTNAADILEGDFLVVAGKDYPVRSCAEWEWRGTSYLALVLEDLKR